MNLRLSLTQYKKTRILFLHLTNHLTMEILLCQPPVWNSLSAYASVADLFFKMPIFTADYKAFMISDHWVSSLKIT